MNQNLSLDKALLEHAQIDEMLKNKQTHIWKNIMKIEALKKEDSLRKSQMLYRTMKFGNK